MQKGKIPNLYLDLSGPAHLMIPQNLRETSDQKITWNKTFLEFNFREGLFNAKNTKYICKDPQFWGALKPPAWPQIKKQHNIKCSLNIYCKVGIFYVKNSKKYFQQVFTHSDPDILTLTSQFKMQLPIVPSPSPQVSFSLSMSHKQKPGKEIDFLETGGFWPRVILQRPADPKPLPKNYLNRVGLVLKISSGSIYSINHYSTCS